MEMEMLEMKNTILGMKSVFDKLNKNPRTTKKGIDERND